MQGGRGLALLTASGATVVLPVPMMVPSLEVMMSNASGVTSAIELKKYSFTLSLLSTLALLSFIL
jgi:hypothetical protein